MLNRKICSVWIWTCLMLATFQAHAWMDGWRDCGDCCYDNNNSGCCWDTALFEIYGGYSFGRDVGVNHSYGTIGATWFPDLDLGTWKPFIDVEGHWLSNGKWAANTGLGVRYLDPCSCDSIWGLNLYYDYRRGDCKKNYNQIGVGVEWLHPNWDVRVNGYIPVGDTKSSCHRNIFEYPGGAVITCVERDCSIGGFDAEIGATLWSCNCWSIYGAIGPYYFRGHKDFHHAFGGRLRFAARWSEWIELAVSGTHDNHYKSRVLGTITVTIPFEALCNPCSCEWSCFSWCDQPVHRQPIIGLDSQTCYRSNFDF